MLTATWDVFRDTLVKSLAAVSGDQDYVLDIEIPELGDEREFTGRDHPGFKYQMAIRVY